jgi:hypothetical protein
MKRLARLALSGVGWLGSIEACACGGPPGVAPRPLDVATAGRSAEPVDPTEAARAAVVIASCTMDMPADYRLLELAQRVYPSGSVDAAAPLVRCFQDHRDGCRAVDECMAMTVERDTPRTTRCDANVAESWLGTMTVRVDCTRLALQCVVTGAIAECIDVTTEECDDASPPRCSADGRPVRCLGGHAQYGVACHQLGMECIPGGSLSYCAGAGGTCAATAAVGYVSYDGERCVDGRLVACVGGGETTLDCRRLLVGAACQTANDGLATRSYCGFGTECAPGKAITGDCEGSSIVVCNGGRIDRVDCRTLGFSRCESGHRSVFGDLYAACAM